MEAGFLNHGGRHDHLGLAGRAKDAVNPKGCKSVGVHEEWEEIRAEVQDVKDLRINLSINTH